MTRRQSGPVILQEFFSHRKGAICALTGRAARHENTKKYFLRQHFPKKILSGSFCYQHDVSQKVKRIRRLSDPPTCGFSDYEFKEDACHELGVLKIVLHMSWPSKLCKSTLLQCTELSPTKVQIASRHRFAIVPLNRNAALPCLVSEVTTSAMPKKSYIGALRRGREFPPKHRGTWHPNRKNTRWIPNDYWMHVSSYWIRSHWSRNVCFTYVYSYLSDICVSSSNRWCSEFFTYEYVYWIPNSGPKTKECTSFPVENLIGSPGWLGSGKVHNKSKEGEQSMKLAFHLPVTAHLQKLTANFGADN